MSTKSPSILLAGALASAALISTFAHDVPVATAQPQTDRQVYAAGKKQYELGNFADAIKLFKQAYEIADNPAYLFNIALAYEQLQDCRWTAYFYQRYLKRASEPGVSKPIDAATKKKVEGLIAKNQECAKTQPPDPTPETDPDTTPDPDPDPDGGGTGVVVGDGDKPPPPPPPEPECITGDEEACGETNVPDDGKPHVIVVRAAGGLGLVGAGPLDVPGQFTAVLSVGYPLALGDKMRLELGAAGAFTPVPYTAMESGGGTSQGSASLTSILANVGFTYDITPKFGLHGALGIGAQLFSGLKAGNPFTNEGAPTTGALTTLSVRAALVAEFHFTPMISAFVTPIAFTYGQAKDGLRDDISALTRLEFLAGLGIRK